LINSTRFVVQAVAVATLATIFSSAIPAAMRAQMDKVQDVQLSAPFGVCETPGVKAENNVPPGASLDLAPAIRQACDVSMAGFEKAYRFTFFASIGALIVGAFLPGWPGKWGGRGSMQAPVAGGH
jgi:hypothetical protein